MEIYYRLAVTEDLEEIASLIKNAIRVMESHGIYQWDDLYPTKEDFQEDIKNGHLYVGVAEKNIAVVFALNQIFDEQYENGKWAQPEKSYVIIHRLCVNPNFQNQGIGRKTLQYIEDQLRTSNVQAIRLDAYSKNPYALSMYFHAGYSSVGYADWRKGRFHLMEKYID